MDFPGGGQVGIDVQVFLGLFYLDINLLNLLVNNTIIIIVD